MGELICMNNLIEKSKSFVIIAFQIEIINLRIVSVCVCAPFPPSFLFCSQENHRYYCQGMDMGDVVDCGGLVSWGWIWMMMLCAE